MQLAQEYKSARVEPAYLCCCFEQICKPYVWAFIYIHMIKIMIMLMACLISLVVLAQGLLTDRCQQLAKEQKWVGGHLPVVLFLTLKLQTAASLTKLKTAWACYSN